MSSSSIPDSVDPNAYIQGIPSMTVEEANMAVEVLTAEELSETPNELALRARDKLRSYLISSGYRNA